MPKADTETPADAPIPSSAPAATPVKVKVPQAGGEIVISTATETKTFGVTGGYVTADTQADADLVVSCVDGASIETTSQK